MVTAVTTDPSLRLNSEKAAKPQAGSGTEPQTRSLSSQAPKADGSDPQIENARRLYRMETSHETKDYQAIKGPAQAREVLARVLEQFTETPDQALQTYQPGSASQIARLLESAPA